MPKLIKYFFFLTTILSFDVDGFDYTLGTKTGNIFPDSKTDSIQMIKERVQIQLKKEKVHVKCIFWLFNSGSRKSVWVGLPDYSKGWIVTKPIENITCKVNGMPEEEMATVKIETNFYRNDITGRKKARRPNQEKYWYKWDISFDENDTVKIETEYDGEWSGVFMCQRSFVYALETGESWNGPILDGRVTFDHSELVTTNFIANKNDSSNLNPTYYEDSTVYTFTNYIPKPNETINVWIFSVNWHPMDEYKSNRCPFKGVNSAQQANAMINDFYALKGYQFKDPNLFEYYKKRKWYHVNSEFDSTKLSEGDKKFIENLKRIENKYKNKNEKE